MSESDFNITSELFTIKIRRRRREKFLEFLRKRFCTENFEVWMRTVDLIDLVRNQSLDVVRLRNNALFDLYNKHVHDASETAMNVTMDLQKKLQAMTSGLRVDPQGRFDVRLILDLQKEAEVLLLEDVKKFTSENPFDDSEDALAGSDMALDGVIRVSYKVKSGAEPSLTSSAGAAAPKHRRESATFSKRKTSSIISRRFSSSSKEGSESKLRVTLTETGELTIYQPQTGSNSGSPGVMFDVHMSEVTVSNPIRPAGSSGALPKKEKSPDFNFSFSASGKDFTFRFKSDEESREWHKSFMKQYEQWRKIRRQRKERRAIVLQAEVGGEAAGSTNMVDNFQGALRRKPSESDGLKAQEKTAMPLQASVSTSSIQSLRKSGGKRRGSLPDAPPSATTRSSEVPTRMAPLASMSSSRQDLVSSAPSHSLARGSAPQLGRQRTDAYLTSNRTPIEVSSSDDSSTDEEDRDQNIVAAQGNACYRALTTFDNTPGLADASMYDMVDTLGPEDDSPLAQMYGGGMQSYNMYDPATGPEVGAGPVLSPGTVLNAYTTKSPYAQLNKGAEEPKKPSEPRALQKDPSGGGNLLDLSDSESSENDAKGEGQFVHQDNLYDFNGIFQQKLQELMALRAGDVVLQPGQLEAVYTSIIRLGEDFVKTALTYGKIIINEKYLPVRHKTIKPSTDMGGVLGGEKYVVHKMLFKFAIDSKGVFRGRDDASAKVAGHELKGLKAYFSVADSELHFPLMALIDYKGFRLIAVSMLPLKSGSLIYGSEDAGATVHAKDPQLNELIENASKRLNLKPHRCGKSDVTVYSPVDLEGHIGQDGRFYLLDFSRVFPPVTPSREVVGGHLFQYFRSEFVYNWPLFPLCSDAYSRFVQGYDDDSRRREKEHKDEVDAATKDLTGITLSNFARELVAMLEEEVRAVGSLKNFRLTEEMHRLGINMRYLGLLVSRLGKFKYAKFLVVHMCARLVKIQIRERLRARMAELKLAVDEPYRICVTDYLNLVFGQSAESTKHWNTDLVALLDQRFSLRPRNWNQFPRDLKEYIWSGLEMKKGNMDDLRIYLFEQIRDMSGITFSDTLESLILGANNDFWQQSRFCDDTDVVDLGAKVKHLDVMSKARGRVFTIRGEEKQRQGYLKSARQLFKSATESFETALSGSPLDPDLLRNCAITMLRIILIDQRLEHPDAPDQETEPPVLTLENPAVARVKRYFVRALQANPEDPFTHLSYAKFMVLCHSFEKAEDHFLESLVLEPNTEKGLLAYAEFLATVRGQAMEAAMFRSRAQKVRGFLIHRGRHALLQQPALNQTLVMPRDESGAATSYTPATE